MNSPSLFAGQPEAVSTKLFAATLVVPELPMVAEMPVELMLLVQ